VDRSTLYNIKINNASADAITVLSGSGITGTAGTNPVANGGFFLYNGMNVHSIIAAGPQGSLGTGNEIHLANLSLEGNPAGGATCYALLYLNSTTDISTFDNLLIWNFAGYGVFIGNSPSLGVGPINFNNPTINGSANAGATPVYIQSVQNGGLMVVNFFGGTIVHPGPGNAMVLINGNGTSAITGVNFYGTYTEASSTTDVDYNINGATNVNLYGVSGQGKAHTIFVNIAGASKGINVYGANNLGATYTIFNTDTGHSYTQNPIQYTYGTTPIAE
jgi:hypothetical protein